MHFVGQPLIEVTAALIAREGRLFIAQRPPMKKFALLWEFPGGKVEAGETLKESLAREIREELCWEIEVQSLFRHLHHEYPDFRINLYAFWCVITEGQLCLKEHVAYHWASLEELVRFNFTRADQQLVSHLTELPKLP